MRTKIIWTKISKGILHSHLSLDVPIFTTVKCHVIQTTLDQMIIFPQSIIQLTKLTSKNNNLVSKITIPVSWKSLCAAAAKGEKGGTGTRISHTGAIDRQGVAFLITISRNHFLLTRISIQVLSVTNLSSPNVVHTCAFSNTRTLTIPWR